MTRLSKDISLEAFVETVSTAVFRAQARQVTELDRLAALPGGPVITVGLVATSPLAQLGAALPQETVNERGMAAQIAQLAGPLHGALLDGLLPYARMSDDERRAWRGGLVARAKEAGLLSEAEAAMADQVMGLLNETTLAPENVLEQVNARRGEAEKAGFGPVMLTFLNVTADSAARVGKVSAPERMRAIGIVAADAAGALGGSIIGGGLGGTVGAAAGGLGGGAALSYFVA